MTRAWHVCVALTRALRDSMLLAWLLNGALVIALVFSIRAGFELRTVLLLLGAVPLVAFNWARALGRLEGKGTPTAR